MFSRPRRVPDDLPALSGMPVARYAVGPADEYMAVHLVGPPPRGRTPLVCVAGLTRNMVDFAGLVGNFRRSFGEDWPIVLVDLKGRGRSSDRYDKQRYTSLDDGQDLAQLLAALAIESAVFVGQGYGGQVLMALVSSHPRLFSGAILVDSGPLSDTRGLVRLRSNLHALEGRRSDVGFRTMFRRMLLADYPALSEARLDALAGRTHYLDRRGRVHGLFDPHFLSVLAQFEYDDILVPQWPLFDALKAVPLLLMRTQLTEQLRRETFEEMLRRRPDAAGFVIEGQGSPALFDTPEDVGPIAEFVRSLVKRRPKAA